MSFFTLCFSLFLIMDSIGHIGSYLKLMRGIPEERHHKILLRELLIALVFMLGFNFLGEFVFQFLQVDEVTVYLSAGLILFLTAIKILFPSASSPRANLPEGEPFIIPLAIPFIAGPSLFATVMLYARLNPSLWVMLTAILIAWAATAIVLFFGKPLHRILGNNGLTAIERLMGMILVLLAIQLFTEGLREFSLQSIAAAPVNG